MPRSRQNLIRANSVQRVCGVTNWEFGLEVRSFETSTSSMPWRWAVLGLGDPTGRDNDGSFG
jgi:hypothetical protein